MCRRLWPWCNHPYLEKDGSTLSGHLAGGHTYCICCWAVLLVNYGPSLGRWCSKFPDIFWIMCFPKSWISRFGHTPEFVYMMLYIYIYRNYNHECQCNLCLYIPTSIVVNCEREFPSCYNPLSILTFFSYFGAPKYPSIHINPMGSWGEKILATVLQWGKSKLQWNGDGADCPYS